MGLFKFLGGCLLFGIGVVLFGSLGFGKFWLMGVGLVLMLIGYYYFKNHN